jgi:hypothetical protein
LRNGSKFDAEVWRLGSFKNSPERSDVGLGLLKFALHPLQVLNDCLVSRSKVWCMQDTLDIIERHTEVPKPANHLCNGHLLGSVETVSAAWVYGYGLEETDLVIVAKGLDA